MSPSRYCTPPVGRLKTADAHVTIQSSQSSSQSSSHSCSQPQGSQPQASHGAAQAQVGAGGQAQVGAGGQAQVGAGGHAQVTTGAAQSQAVAQLQSPWRRARRRLNSPAWASWVVGEKPASAVTAIPVNMRDQNVRRIALPFLKRPQSPAAHVTGSGVAGKLRGLRSSDEQFSSRELARSLRRSSTWHSGQHGGCG